MEAKVWRYRISHIQISVPAGFELEFVQEEISQKAAKITKPEPQMREWVWPRSVQKSYLASVLARILTNEHRLDFRSEFGRNDPILWRPFRAGRRGRVLVGLKPQAK
jgi:hypothetical protein